MPSFRKVKTRLRTRPIRHNVLKVFVLVLLVFSLNNASLCYSDSEDWVVTGMTREGISSIIVTEKGLFAGHNNWKYWDNPYNGIFFSPDEGAAWFKRGLEKHGVSDLAFSNGILYAAVNTGDLTQGNPPGLYRSIDYGSKWENIGPSVRAVSVSAYEGTILLGTYKEGLWISHDSGASWTHIEELKERLKNILEVRVWENFAYAREPNNIFISTDKGKTWEEYDKIPASYINQILLEITGSYISTKYIGVRYAEDHKTPIRSIFLPTNQSAERFLKYGIKYFVAARDRTTNQLRIFESQDKGSLWTTTGPYGIYAPDGFSSLVIIDSSEPTLFAAIPSAGIYRKKVKIHYKKNPIFGPLWEGQEEGDLIDKITAFFDHAYPFFGYVNYLEPPEHSLTTVNFLGQEEPEPKMYYSGHNGHDFGLPYGTNILAPADGLIYYLYCPPCGYSQYIDHAEGYRTVYMHLQRDELFAQPGEMGKPISKGDIVGRVGMTGNTTGPHLHFETRLIEGEPNYYKGRDPSSLTDPFGWRSIKMYDPWKYYCWNDPLGSFCGLESQDLWESSTRADYIKKDFLGEPLSIELGNFTLQIPKDTTRTPSTFYLAKGARQTNPGKDYVEGTSFIIEATDRMGNIIHELEQAIIIRIHLNKDMLSKIKLDTLGLYRWDEKKSKWDTVPSLFDYGSSTIKGTISHISQFAVFGTATDTHPNTTAVLTGEMKDHWYIEFPLVTLSTDKPAKTFYSIYEEYWEEYKEPFYLEWEGISLLKYRSTGEPGPTEPLQTKNVRINTQGKIHKTLFIDQSRIEISQGW